MRVAVTGATGFLGFSIARELLARGIEVVASGRRTDRLQALRDRGALVIAGDLRDEGVCRSVVGESSHVIHSAARAAPSGRWADFFVHNARVTELLLGAARRAAVERFVFVSSASIYQGLGPRLGVTEEAPLSPRLSAYAASKLAGEDRCRSAHRAGLATVILRPRAIIGAGDPHILPRIVAALRRRRLPVLGKGDALVDLTPVKSAAHAACLCLSAPPGETYHVSNGTPVPLWPLLREVAKAQGVPAPKVRVPYRTARLLASALEVATPARREPPLTRYTLDMLAHSLTLDITKIQRELGFSPTDSVERSVRRALLDLGAGGQR